MSEPSKLPDISFFSPSAVVEARRAEALDNAAFEIMYAWDDACAEGRPFEHVEKLKTLSLTSWVSRSGTGLQLNQAKQKLSVVRPETMNALEVTLEHIKKVTRNAEKLKAEYLAKNPQYAEKIAKEEAERRIQARQEYARKTFGLPEEVEAEYEAAAAAEAERRRQAILTPGVYVPKSAEADTGSRITDDNTGSRISVKKPEALDDFPREQTEEEFFASIDRDPTDPLADLID